MMNPVKDILAGIGDSVKQGVIDGMKEGLIKLLTWIGTGILSGSYWICIAVAIIALILYIGGHKKYGKYVGFSVILYFILQGIKVAVL